MTLIDDCAGTCSDVNDDDDCVFAVPDFICIQLCLLFLQVQYPFVFISQNVCLSLVSIGWPV